MVDSFIGIAIAIGIVFVSSLNDLRRTEINEGK